MSTIPSWDASRRCLTVESLEPLCRLERLESLSLMGVTPLDGRLDWLQQLKTLKYLHISHVFQFQLEDYAALARALPEAVGPLSAAVLRDAAFAAALQALRRRSGFHHRPAAPRAPPTLSDLR